MSQCCHHMSPCGHFLGPVWPLLGPHFLPPPRCCVTIFRSWINACIGRQHEPKMTQHGLYIGAQGFKNNGKHNVFQTFSFLHNVTMLLSYVSPWHFFWTSLAPFGTPFSSTPPPPLCFFNFFSHCFWWCINACIGWQHEAKNPKWPNMVHILEPKASKIVKNTTFFKHFHFWTMSQFGRHMSLHGHFCGPNWCHLGPFFLPPPSFFLRGMGGCVTIFRCCINACIGRQHGPKMTQHGSHIGTQHYHIGVFWSILDHLEATLAKYGAQLGSILVHLGPFWTHWGRTWN